LSSGGVADKEMDDVPPTIETLTKQAPPPVSIQQPSELGQILARLVIGQEKNPEAYGTTREVFESKWRVWSFSKSR